MRLYLVDDLGGHCAYVFANNPDHALKVALFGLDADGEPIDTEFEDDKLVVTEVHPREGILAVEQY